MAVKNKKNPMRWILVKFLKNMIPKILANLGGF
jgi:hypothetical protein